MSNVRAGFLVIIVVLAGYFLLKSGSSPEEQGLIRARLSDVRGIPVGAPVTLAGLPVGEIVEQRVGSGYAEIDIRFAKRITLREDAVLYKRRTSLLSGPSLELDPGSADKPLGGKYILRVVETSPLGDILYDISEALPAIGRGAATGVDQAEDWRAQVKGPFSERLAKMTTQTEDIQTRMHARLESINQGLEKTVALEYDPEKAIGARLDRADELAILARNSLEEASVWVSSSASDIRTKMDESKLDLSPYSKPIADVDQGQGTLGTLVNSDELHEDLVETTRDLRGFVRSMVSWQMKVGLRTEWAVTAATGRAYLTLRAGRPYRYYYFELLAGPRGGIPDVTAVYDPALGTWRRRIEIRDSIRLTAQWARRMGPMVLRYGLKESSFGAGSDVYLFNDRLELSADIFEFGQADRPRLKLAATYRVFGQLYILAGLDDVLNKGQRYNIDPLGSEFANRLDEVYVGRDYYLGGTLRFSDKDMATLLRIGGEVVGSLLP